MLKATEQLTWSAKLTKFARGRPEHGTNSAYSSSVSSHNGSRIAWQHFSGDALCIRLLCSRPTQSDWPAKFKETRTRLSASGSGPTTAQLDEDRKFTIAVEWERADTEPSQRQSFVQPSQPVILVCAPLFILAAIILALTTLYCVPQEQLDVVKIHQAAHRAGFRDWAINAIHRDSLVGLRYRHEDRPELVSFPMLSSD